jgi:hypothetical protein
MTHGYIHLEKKPMNNATSLRATALMALALVSVAACDRTTEAPAAAATGPAPAAGTAAKPAQPAKRASNVPAPEGAPKGAVRFGDFAMLRLVQMACTPDGLHIRLDWSPLPGNKGQRMNNAVHLLDANNKLVLNLDYPAQPWPAGSKPDSTRTEKFRVPAVTLAKIPAVKLGLGVYNPVKIVPLPVDRGPGVAPPALLIMPLKDCTAQ